MKNITDYFQNPIQRKYIAIIVVAIFVVLSSFIIFNNNSTIKTNTTLNPNNQIIDIPDNTLSPTPTKTPPFPTPKLTLISKINEIAESKEKMHEYTNTYSLASIQTQNNLYGKLGFSSSNKINTDSKNLLLWNKDDKSLAIKILENTIIFTSIAPPPQSGTILSKEEAFSTGRQIISLLFDNNIESSLINQAVDYYKTNSAYASLAAIGDADLARVSFYQSIDNLPVVSISETGAVFTLYIDKNKNLHSMSISGGFSQISQGKEVSLIPFSEAKTLFDLAIRINTSSDLKINFMTAGNKNINFTNNNSQLAYLLVNRRFVPVYLLSGTISGAKVPTQEGLYIIPATKTN